VARTFDERRLASVSRIPELLLAAIHREYPDGRLDSTLGDAGQRKEGNDRVMAAVKSLGGRFRHGVSHSSPDWHYEHSHRVAIARPGSPPWPAFLRLSPAERAVEMRRAPLAYWDLRLCGFAPFWTGRLLQADPSRDLFAEMTDRTGSTAAEWQSIGEAMMGAQFQHLDRATEQLPVPGMVPGGLSDFPAFEEHGRVLLGHCVFSVH
jgi:hypothetical protein